ncbi:uncharacterized protein IWZ02DRAFT_442571 [Phyllosticta citriasiana]|uniref:Secreted protein n=1 Tax=Phyllosticta citriasiana TaxID=595635 RepID=A0ABR1KU68_9PEZI
MSALLFFFFIGSRGFLPHLLLFLFLFYSCRACWIAQKTGPGWASGMDRQLQGTEMPCDSWETPECTLLEVVKGNNQTV